MAALPVVLSDAAVTLSYTATCNVWELLAEWWADSPTRAVQHWDATVSWLCAQCVRVWTATGCTRHLWHVQASLAQLYTLRGQHTEARELLATLVRGWTVLWWCCGA